MVNQDHVSAALTWVTAIRDQCVVAGVPFFFKQWGRLRSNPDPTDPTAKENGGPAKGGSKLNGRVWDQLPTPQEHTVPA